MSYTSELEELAKRIRSEFNREERRLMDRCSRHGKPLPADLDAKLDRIVESLEAEPALRSDCEQGMMGNC